MALTLNDFVGFETGGLEEANSTAGTPIVGSNVVRTGNYSLEINSGSDSYYIHPFSIVSDAGDDQIVGLAVYFTDLSPAVDSAILWVNESGIGAPNYDFRLTLQTDGDLECVFISGGNETITTPFIVNTWHYIEIKWQHSDSGSFIIYIDGVQAGSYSGKDMSRGDTFDEYQFGQITENSYFDDIYCMSGASSVSDFLGPRTEVLGAFQNTVEDGTDQGDTLSVGSWNDAGDTPGADEATWCEYTSNPEAGHTRCDEGNRAGPAEFITGTSKGAKWIFRLEMGGTKTPVYHRVGKFVLGGSDTTQDISFTPIRNDANYFYIEESTTYMPNADDEVFCQGGNIDSGNDMGFLEMWSMLLHVRPDPATLDLSDMGFPLGNYYCGPFQNDELNLYLVMVDPSRTRLYILKCTGDPTTLSNWSVQDKVIQIQPKVASMWAVDGWNDIFVAVQCGEENGFDGTGYSGSNGSVFYCRFDTKNDEWLILKEQVIGTDNGSDTEYCSCSIGVRDGIDVIIMYNHNGATPTAIHYARRESDVWTTGIEVEEVAANTMMGGCIVRGSSQRMHFLYHRWGTGWLRHRSLSNANILDTAKSADTSTYSAGLHITGRGISYYDGTNVIVMVPFLDSNQQISIARFNSGADPTISVDANASDNDGFIDANDYWAIMCMAIDLEAWLMYSEDLTQDVFSDKRADGGSWGTDTEEEDAVTCNALSCASYWRADNMLLGYVWLNGSTMNYDEKDIDPTGLDLSDVLFPETNYHVGPHSA